MHLAGQHRQGHALEHRALADADGQIAHLENGMIHGTPLLRNLGPRSGDVKSPRGPFSGRYGAFRILSRTKLSGAAPTNSAW